jgi:very-short-patch-repair endonuclease
MDRASISNNSHYNPNLKEKAQRLRLEMTKSEAVLWKHALKQGKLFGFRFNRQRPILDYIVDFMSKEL